MATLDVMFQELVSSYRPMQIDMLLDVIRQDNDHKWQQIDVRMKYGLCDIINFLMSRLHNDTSRLNPNSVKQVEPTLQDRNEDVYINYYNYLLGTQGNSIIRDIFGIQMIFDSECLCCKNAFRKLRLCWQYEVPINLHWLRFWTVDWNGDCNATFMFVTAQTLITKPKIEDCFSLIVQEIEGDDDDVSIQVVNHRFITIDDQLKYVVFAAYLAKTANGWLWTAQDWFTLLDTTTAYNQQCRYSLVFQEIDSNTNIEQEYYFETHQYDIMSTQQRIPKSYPQIKFQSSVNNGSKDMTQVQVLVEKVVEVTEEHQTCLHPPMGDRRLALFEQLEQTVQCGYLKHCFCDLCHKITPMNVKPSIYKLKHLLMINLIQEPNQYYEIQWNPQKRMHGLQISSNQTINVEINAYMSKNSQNQYSTHFKINAKPKAKTNKKKKDKKKDKKNEKKNLIQWYHMTNEKTMQNSLATNSQHACLLLVSNIDRT